MTEQTGNKTNTGKPNAGKQNEDIVKITIRKEAEERLTQVMERVNNGFDAGKVNRQDLASWALIRFAKDCTAETIKMIRQDHFDEMALLEVLLKRSKEQGQLPPELKNALRQHIGMESGGKRATKAPLTSDYINDVTSAEKPKKETE